MSPLAVSIWKPWPVNAGGGERSGWHSRVVVPGETGYLVDPDLSSEPPDGPRHAAQFAQELAEALIRLLADPALLHRMKQGRAWVEQHYGWRAMAQQTLALYQRLCGLG